MTLIPINGFRVSVFEHQTAPSIYIVPGEYDSAKWFGPKKAAGLLHKRDGIYWTEQGGNTHDEAAAISMILGIVHAELILSNRWPS